jgi:hypothetical protein
MTNKHISAEAVDAALDAWFGDYFLDEEKKWIKDQKD